MGQNTSSLSAEICRSCAFWFFSKFSLLNSKENSELVFTPPIYIPIQSFHQLFHDVENPILSVQITKMPQVWVVWSCCCYFRTGFNTFVSPSDTVRDNTNKEKPSRMSVCLWVGVAGPQAKQQPLLPTDDIAKGRRIPAGHFPGSETPSGVSSFAHHSSAGAREQLPHREETGMAPVPGIHRALTQLRALTRLTKGHGAWIALPGRLQFSLWAFSLLLQQVVGAVLWNGSILTAPTEDTCLTMDRDVLQITQAVEKSKGNWPVFYCVPVLLKCH